MPQISPPLSGPQCPKERDRPNTPELNGAEVLDLTKSHGAESTPPSEARAVACQVSSSEVVVDPHAHKNSDNDGSTPNNGPLLKHATNLSTPERPAVPKEERDRPNTPDAQWCGTARLDQEPWHGIHAAVRRKNCRMSGFVVGSRCRFSHS